MKTLSPFKMLCGAGLLAIFSSTISKSPVLPLYAQHLGAEPSAVGAVAAVSAATGIVVSIPAGLLSDRFGRRRLLLVAGAVFASAPWLYLFVTSIWQLALIRFYHGLATAIFVPVAMALVSDLFHGERGERLGWFSTSTLVGRFVAPLVGGSLLGLLAFNELLGYRAVYLTCAVAGFVSLLAMLKIDAPDEQKRATAGRWRESWAAFKSVAASRGILITALMEAAILFAYGTFETFLPLAAREAGISAYGIGAFLAAQIITLALTKPLMGRFSDRHGRRPQILAGALAGAACIAGFSLFSSFPLLLAFSILFGLSLSVVTSATSALIADLSRRETHGSAMGILGSVMDIGHTTGPLAAGVVAQYYGFGRSFLLPAAVLLVAATAFRLALK